MRSAEKPARRRVPSHLPTLIVVAAFAILLAYVLLVETKKEVPASPDAAPSAFPLLASSVDALERVRISDGDRTVSVLHQGEEWWILEARAEEDAGTRERADAYTIRWPLDELARLEAKLVVLEDVPDPATFGLDTALILEIETQAGESEQIRVGRETPDGTAFYVQRKDDPQLYLVAHYKLAPFFDWLLTPPYQPTPTPDAG